MILPDITAEDIQRMIPGVKVVGQPISGGQRRIFCCMIGGKKYALKVMLTNPLGQPDINTDISPDDIDVITARARREIEILRKCDTPHIVKMGPIQLTHNKIKNQSIIYFTEEWIEGQDLRAIIKEQDLPLNKVVRLAKHITEAVKILWSMDNIHRDIKPENIMRRNINGDFVLLDMGFAFDLKDIFLTPPGFIVGTTPYLSPEQITFIDKRQMDFRSDLFSLGVVLYEVATKRHPFLVRGINRVEVQYRIVKFTPQRPSKYREEISPDLDTVIMKLLAKMPYLRYRTCDQLLNDLNEIKLD